MPATSEHLHRFGERLRLARKRRKLSSKQVAERAGMAPMTLRSLERGGSGVTMGAYLAVMQVLGIERDFDLLGQADPLGRELQDTRLPAARTVAAISRARVVPDAEVDVPVAPLRAPEMHARDATDDSNGWVSGCGFTTSRALAELIKPAKPVAKKRRV